MGLSFLTASAHDAAGAKGNDIVRVTVERTDEKEMVYPEEELTFTVIVELLSDHTIGDTTVSPDVATDGGNLYGPDYDATAAASDPAANRDQADVDLSSTVSYIAFEKVKYKVRSVDLGAAQSRTATLTWSFHFFANGHGDPGDATTALVATGSVDVEVMKRPAGEGGAAQLDLDFSDSTAPTGDDIARGAEVTFKLTASTGDYKIGAKSLVIKKQLYDGDGDKVGNLVSVASIAIPELDSNSESASLASGPKTYKLLQSEVDEIEDGGKLEFSYSHVIREIDVYKAGTNTNESVNTGIAITNPTAANEAIPVGATARIDLDGDGNLGARNAANDNNVYDTVKLEGTIITVMMDAPEPEATPDPSIIGMNDAATVTLSEDGNSIEVAPTDGVSFSLLIGRLYTDGSAQFVNGGYIRQDRDPQGRGYGQTYGIVKRDHDGKIVRKWISSADPVVMSGGIDWPVVEMHYTYPRDVISAIPLDEMYPANNQLVRNDANGKIYVYRTGAWRHIPDTATFKYHGFFWCDVTSADADFFTRFTEGGALAPSGTADDPNYPSCHNM
jgi:hypothetical protein